MSNNNDLPKQQDNFEESNIPKGTDAIVPSNDDATVKSFPIEPPNEKSLDIQLPQLKYGYRTVPCTWEELIDIIVRQKDLAKLSRSQQQQYNYEVYKQTILQQWDTMTDYVLCTKFPHVFTKTLCIQQDTSRQKRWKADPSLQSITTTHIQLIKNDFPYYLENDIEHWILWKVGGGGGGGCGDGTGTNCCTITDNDIDKAKIELYLHHNIQKDYIIHWINPIELKSIPLIDHVHILGKVQKY
jgi:Protein of unknown function (DUF3605)